MICKYNYVNKVSKLVKKERPSLPYGWHIYKLCKEDWRYTSMVGTHTHTYI